MAVNRRGMRWGGLAVLMSGALAQADISLPLSSFRSQGTTDHCWAYSASHLLESRAEYRTQVSVVLDTERDLRYWVLYDRFFRRYQTQSELDGGMDDAGGILEEGGYPTEYWAAFAKHGHPTRQVTKVSGLPGYVFPTPLAAVFGFFAANRPSAPPLDSAGLIQSLGQATDDQAADQLIRAALDASPEQLTAPMSDWLDGQVVSTAEIPAQMFPGGDAPILTTDELVWLMVPSSGVAGDGVGDGPGMHQWDSYLNGKYKIFYVSPGEMTAYAKQSLDAGWPILDTSFGHIWAVIGYTGDSFVVADSAASEITYAQGLSAVAGVFVRQSLLLASSPAARRTLPKYRLRTVPNAKVRVFSN